MKYILTILSLVFTNIIVAQDSLDVAFVKTKQDQWQLIDRNGRVLADSLFEHDSLTVFTCGFQTVVFERGGKYGLKNFRNEIDTKPSYDSISRFIDNNAAVLQNGKWFLVGGKQTIKPISAVQAKSYFAVITDANCMEGYCLTEVDSSLNCKTPDGKLLLNKSDDMVAPWNDVAAFRSNRILKYKIMANKVCSCQKLTNYYGFIDCNGKWAIEANFEQADIFSCGLASVSEGTENIYLYGYIGMDGKWEIEPVYKEAGRFMRVYR